MLPVPHDNAESVWHLVEPLIRKAVDVHPGYEMDDVLEAILHRDMQLWISVTDRNEILVAWVTQILVFPRMKTLQILFMGGRQLRRCAHHMNKLQEYALSVGCSEMGAISRRGLVKWFPAEDSGMIYMTRDLSEEKEHG